MLLKANWFSFSLAMYILEVHRFFCSVQKTTLNSKAWVVGCLNFCHEVTKIYQLKKSWKYWKLSECTVLRGKKIVSKLLAVGCLNFFLNVTKIYQLKNWKCCLLLEKMSKNCQSVQLQGVRKFVSKMWVVGCPNFCLKVTKRYKLKKIKILFDVEENVQNLSECTMLRDIKIVTKVWIVGWLNFCLKGMKRYQLNKNWNIVWFWRKSPKNVRVYSVKG